MANYLRLKSVTLPAAILAFGLATLSHGEAASLYWSGGDGSWDDTLWTLNSDLAGPFQAWSNTGPNAAVFSGIAGTVSLGSPITAASLAFATDGYAVTGNTITLSAVTTLDSSTGTQTIGSVLAGATTSLTKTGAGTIKLTGANTYTGSTTVSGGTLTVDGSGASIGVSSASASTMSVGPGTSATLNIVNGGSVKNTTASLGSSGTRGTVLIDGAGSLWTIANTSGTTFSIAAGGAASMTISNGGALKIASTGTFAAGTGQTADFLLTGAGSSLTTNTGTFRFGGAGTTTASIEAGAKATIATTLNIGLSSTAGAVTNVTATGAGTTVTANGTGGIALGGGTNSLTISNGATVASPAAGMTIGNDSTSISTVTVGNGGTLTTGARGTVVGDTGKGTLNLQPGSTTSIGYNFRLGNGSSATGIVNQTGGTITVAQYMEFFLGTVEYHLLGGTYIGQDVGSIAGINVNAPTSYLFELGGGTVQAGTNNLTVNANATLKAGTTSTISTPLSINQYVYWGGTLSGDGTLKKTDQGILILSQASTYTGGTILDQGILNPAASGSLGTGALTITGNSTIQLPNSQTVTVTLANPITINNGVTATMSVQNRTLTLNGAITGDGSLVKSGASLLVLGGDDSFTGPTTISAGILRTASATALSPSSNLRLNGGVLEVGAGGTTDFSYGTGGGQLQWTGSGGFSASGANRTINYESGAGLIWGAANFVPAGSTFILSSGASDSTTIFSNNIDFAGAARTVQVDGGTAAIDATLSGVLSNGSLVKTGLGTLALTGVNTYAGGTTISGGALNFASGSLGSAPLTVNGGELQWATGNTEDITAGGRVVSLGSGGSTFNTNGNDVSLANALIGAGAFAKSGAGTLTLNGVNTYGGSTSVTGGTLVVPASTAIPSGSTLNLGGGTFSGGATSSPTAITFGNPLTVTANSAIGGAVPLIFTGALTNSGGSRTLAVDNTGLTTFGNIFLSDTSTGRTLTLAGAGNVAITGVIANRSSGTSGAGSLTKSGAGTLTLSGVNTYTGTTTVSAGTLRATTSASALGTGAASLAVSGTGSVELANDTGLTFARNTTVSATTANFTSDVLTNGGAGVTHTLGTLSIGAQTLVLNKGANVGSGTAGLTFGATSLTASGATFTVGTGTRLTLGAVSGSGRGFTVGGAGATAITGAITTGSGALTKTDEGTLTLSGANTYTGITTISGGTLQFAKLASLYNGTPANWTAAKLIVGSGATAVFNVGGTGEFTAANLDTLKSLGGASNGFTSGSFLGMDTTNAGGNFSYLSSIADPNGNVLGLTKSGPGSLTLSGASTYTGATTVSAGRLVVDGSITSATTVNSGGTLGGHGTVGAVTIKSGGVISPGNSPGTLTTGAEDWNGGGSYVWELNNASDAAGAKGVSYDWLNIGGALNLTASSGTPFTIYVTSLTSGNVAGVAPGFVFRASYQWIIASASSIPTFSADMFRIDTSAFANDPANQGGFAIVQSGNDIVLTYTSVPEPKQWGVVFGLALGGFIFLRRRRIGRVGKS